MDIQSEVLSLFGCPLYKSHVDLSNEEKDCVLNQLNYEPNHDHGTFLGKDKHLFRNNHPQLVSIHQKIQQHVDNFGYNGLGLDEQVKCTIIGSWGILIPAGKPCHNHNHKVSSISGVLYIQSGDQSGALRLNSPNRSVFDNSVRPLTREPNQFNSDLYNIVPSDGLIVMFPSYVTHGVLFNQSGQDRCSLAFDVFFEGKMARDYSDNYVVSVNNESD